MSTYLISFEPLGQRRIFPENYSLLECARSAGIGIAAVCGGHGSCHACRIRLVKGNLTSPTKSETSFFSHEELIEGWRLACQAYPRSNCRIYIPADSMTTNQKLQVEGGKVNIRNNPLVKSYRLKLKEPSFENLIPDAERLCQALKTQHDVSCHRIDDFVLRALSPKLRTQNWQCRVVTRNREIIGVNGNSDKLLGLAVDMGTTKIAAYLMDLTTGKTLATTALMNPQISYGEDVISRINFAIASPENSLKMQLSAVQALNDICTSLCKESGSRIEQIAEAVVVANTAIHHLLLNLPVAQLARSPYIAAVQSAMDIKARNIGLNLAPGAYLHLLPNIAGFIGADHTAALLATALPLKQNNTLLIDIGTNTEVSLIANGKLSSVSCASGPAFEGGHIRFGMRASEGAIEKILIKDDEVNYRTVNDAPPVGICGSGIMDALAQLYLNGIIDHGGRMLKDGPGISTPEKLTQYKICDIANDAKKGVIYVTQADIRELQLAKAAIRTGIQALLDGSNITDEDIAEVIIAGAFGSYIDVASAVTCGMLPPLPLSRFHQVGNAAGTGARMALISKRQRIKAADIALASKYIELARAPSFNDTFITACYLGKYHIVNGKRKDI